MQKTSFLELLVNSQLVFLQRSWSSKVLSAAVTKTFRIQRDVEVDSFDVTIPSTLRIKTLLTRVTLERQLEVVCLRQVSQQHPLSDKLLAAYFADDRTPLVTVLDVHVIPKNVRMDKTS